MVVVKRFDDAATESACRRCAKPVLWIPRDPGPRGGRAWHPPLDPASKRKRRNGVTDYLPHQCVEAPVPAAAATGAVRTTGRPASPASPALVKPPARTRSVLVQCHDAVEEYRRKEWHQALRVACRECDARIGVICVDLAERKRGRERKVKWPHRARTWDVSSPEQREKRFAPHA